MDWSLVLACTIGFASGYGAARLTRDEKALIAAQTINRIQYLLTKQECDEFAKLISKATTRAAIGLATKTPWSDKNV